MRIALGWIGIVLGSACTQPTRDPGSELVGLYDGQHIVMLGSGTDAAMEFTGEPITILLGSDQNILVRTGSCLLAADPGASGEASFRAMSRCSLSLQSGSYQMIVTRGEIALRGRSLTMNLTGTAVLGAVDPDGGVTPGAPKMFTWTVQGNRL